MKVKSSESEFEKLGFSLRKCKECGTYIVTGVEEDVKGVVSKGASREFVLSFCEGYRREREFERYKEIEGKYQEFCDMNDCSTCSIGDYNHTSCILAWYLKYEEWKRVAKDES